MIRLSVVTGFMVLLVALVVSTGRSGDKGTQPKKQPQLPAGFGKLGLSVEQKKKVYSIRASYSVKIEDLKEKIEQMKKDEYAEMLKVLSEDQRKKLREILLKDFPPDDKGKEKRPADDKKAKKPERDKK